jgi:hypothetical protein
MTMATSENDGANPKEATFANAVPGQFSRNSPTRPPSLAVTQRNGYSHLSLCYGKRPAKAFLGHFGGLTGMFFGS